MADTTNSGKIRLRRGTTSEWTAGTKTLYEGQPGIEYTSGKPRMKVGPKTTPANQTTPWGSCDYITPDINIYSDTAAVNTSGKLSITSSEINTAHTPTAPSGMDSIGAGAFVRNIVISTQSPSNASNYLEGTIWIKIPN